MKDFWANLPKRTRCQIGVVLVAVVTIVGLAWWAMPDTVGGYSAMISYSELLERAGRGEVQKLSAIKISNTVDILKVSLADGKVVVVWVDTNYVKPAEDLKSYKVEMQFEPPPPNHEYRFLIFSIGSLVIIAYTIYLLARGIGPKGEIYLKPWGIRTKASTSEVKLTFADIAGVDEAMAELQEVVEFLKNPEKAQRLGGRIPKGVLLLGPPGCGKTLLARIIASEASVPFFPISGSDFVEMFVGVGAKRVRELFAKGKAVKKCIIFIDEIDGIGAKRSTSTSGGEKEDNKTLNQLLVEMDGFDQYPGIVVIGSTNRPDILDPALLRPGRFDRRVTVSPPNAIGREEILKLYAHHPVILDPEINLKDIALGTPEFTGADLKNLVNEAALHATWHDKEAVALDDFVFAKDKVILGLKRSSRGRLLEDKRTTRYHESGHAFVSARLKYAQRIEKVSTALRGFSGGVTQFIPSESESTTLKKLNAVIVVMMGGRAAERLFLEDVSIGAQNDLEHANTYIRRMIEEWGMSSLGPISINNGSQTDIVHGMVASDSKPTYSESLRQKIDDIQRKMAKNALLWAEKFLTNNKELFKNLVEKFTDECEVVDAKEIYALVEGLILVEIKNLEDDDELKTEL